MFDGMTTVTQGTVGVTAAIWEFTKRGWWVCVPINDNQPYDLIVDRGDGPRRVQVKTSSFKPYAGNYTILLQSVRSNKTKNIIKHFDNTIVDELFILCDDGSMYSIPAKDVMAKSGLSLGSKYKKYKLDSEQAKWSPP